MQTYLCSLGYDIWELVRVGYIPLPSTSSLDVAAKKAFENDSNAKNALMCGLKDNELCKVHPQGCKGLPHVRGDISGTLGSF